MQTITTVSGYLTEDPKLSVIPSTEYNGDIGLSYSNALAAFERPTQENAS